jgi:glyoxylase I family protein
MVYELGLTSSRRMKEWVALEVQSEEGTSTLCLTGRFFPDTLFIQGDSMIKQLAHVCIYSTDLDATTRFYCEGLELERGFEFVRNGDLFGYYINLGENTFIEVFKGEPGTEGNIKHIAIEVDDMDQIITRLREYGYEVGDKSLEADHSWQAWTTDPNGVKIEFHEYTDDSLQLTGGTCLVDW